MKESLCNPICLIKIKPLVIVIFLFSLCNYIKAAEINENQSTENSSGENTSGSKFLIGLYGSWLFPADHEDMSLYFGIISSRIWLNTSKQINFGVSGFLQYGLIGDAASQYQDSINYIGFGALFDVYFFGHKNFLHFALGVEFDIKVRAGKDVNPKSSFAMGVVKLGYIHINQPLHGCFQFNFVFKFSGKYKTTYSNADCSIYNFIGFELALMFL